MYLKSLALRNFRNFKDAKVEFSEKFNIFYGQNAQGKTNLLEAIYLVSTGRSFRTQNLSQLIYDQEPFFFLEAEIFRDGVNQVLQLFFDGQKKQLKIDGQIYASFHPLLGILPIVLYTPYDIECVMGPPAERRRLLNLHLAQIDPLYVHHLTCFWRAMQQRNCLLKMKIEESIECWEAQMAVSASYIGSSREKMLKELNPSLFKQAKKLSASEELHEITLNSSFSKDYLGQLKKNRIKEMQLGVTLSGPHRDDLDFLINGKSARHFASEGQKKTLIAAMKLAEWERLSERFYAKALMGFDDVAQNLDGIRLKMIQKELETLGQVFITSPDLKTDLNHSHFIEGGEILKT